MFGEKKNNLKKGAAMMTAVVFFLFISLTVVLGVTGPVYKEVRLSRDLVDSKESFFLSESGQEDVIFRLKNGLTVSDYEDLAIGSSVVTTAIVDNAGLKIITSNATSSQLVRKVKTELFLGEGISFNFGVQVGDGGLYMKNNSFVSGNVFSDGSITADNNPLVDGDVVSSGPEGLIENLEVGGDALAHTIRNSEVGGDAYYQVISNTSVVGTQYSNSSDQATTTLPISDSKIEEWEAQALTGGTTSICEIENSTIIGPIKFNCDTLTIKGSPTVTLAGPIWVEGNIEVENNVEMTISQSLGSNSVAIIAHNESNESGSGTILLKNNTTFAGPNNNFILLISMNNDAEENSGSTKAIVVENSAVGDLLVYAPHGITQLKNNVDLKEVTSYQLEVENNAQVVYDTGLVNLLFSSELSDGYSINSWKEIE
jgi:hypothetical protein